MPLRKYVMLVSLIFKWPIIPFVCYSDLLPQAIWPALWTWTPPSLTPLPHKRRAVRLAPQVACPWPGFDPAPSPMGPTSTRPPPALLPPPPPPRIARPSAVPPLTTGSGDTATSVSLFSNVFVQLPVFQELFFTERRRDELPVWVFGSSVPHAQNIPYVSLYVSSLCCPPQQRRALHACHAPQKESHQHGRAGTAGGADAIAQGQLQRDGESQPPPLQPDGQQCQQPQQVWDSRSTQRHDCHHGERLKSDARGKGCGGGQGTIGSLDSLNQWLFFHFWRFSVADIQTFPHCFGIFNHILVNLRG